MILEVNKNKVLNGKRNRDEELTQIPGSRISKSRRSVNNSNPTLLTTELPSFSNGIPSVYPCSKEVKDFKLPNKLTSLFRPAFSTTSSFSQSLKLPLATKRTQLLLQNHKLLEQKASKRPEYGSETSSQYKSIFPTAKQRTITTGPQKLSETRPFQKCFSKLDVNQCTLTSLNRRKKDEKKNLAEAQSKQFSFFQAQQSKNSAHQYGSSNCKSSCNESNVTDICNRNDMNFNEQHVSGENQDDQFAQKYPWLLSRQQSYQYNQSKTGECFKSGMLLVNNVSNQTLSSTNNPVEYENVEKQLAQCKNDDCQMNGRQESYYINDETKKYSAAELMTDDECDSKDIVEVEEDKVENKEEFAKQENQKLNQEEKKDTLPCLLQYKETVQDKNSLLIKNNLLRQFYAKESLKNDESIENIPTTACSLRYSKENNNNNNILAKRYSLMKDCDDYTDSKLLYGLPLLNIEQALLHKQFSDTCVDYDMAGYGHFWLIHHKKRENLFQPWQLTLTGKIESLRLGVMAMYWESVKYHPVSLPTIYVAISNFNRLLSSWTSDELERPSPSQWALTAVVAYRLACKLEERPEVLWEFTNFWDFFPMFTDWTIDRSDANLNKVEMAALNILNDSMDIPLAPMFVSLYLTAGGWPIDVAKEYKNLAMYILGVVTFTSTKDHLLKNVIPSTLAIAALILAIKIVNGDRGTSEGILPHLSQCPRYVELNSEAEFDSKNDACICRYEFYPERLKTYCNLQLTELLPVIRGLSSLLRAKPDETYVLKYSFPLWGEHDWR